MTMQSWLIYLGLVLVATSTPGPAVLFIVTKSTFYGWKKAVFSALGNISGLFCLGVVAVTGLGALLKTSEMVFNLVKYAGAAYLVYLGLKMLANKGKGLSFENHGLIPEKFSPAKIFLQAFAVAVSNPKAIVFLTALFPQFINVQAPVAPQFAMLISVLMAFSFTFLMLYAILASTARNWLAKPGRTNVFNRAGGSLFIGFGLLLATSSNK